eukprot:COSAG01_NODE_27349_length_688_cov_0.738540_1_plen_25_part_10
MELNSRLGRSAASTITRDDRGAGQC